MVFRWMLSSKHATLAKRRLEQEIALLRRSPLLDPVWYRDTYPDIRNSPIDVSRHYIENGAREGRNPHPLFDTKYYLEQNPEIAKSGQNPLVHYIQFGGSKGFDPHPWFDTKFYIEQDPPIDLHEVNPLVHYLLFGRAAGRLIRKSERTEVLVQRELIADIFDSDYYLAAYPDVADSGIDPLEHFTKFGGLELRNPNSVFDSSWYAARNQDTRSAYPIPILHYMIHGASELRDPSLLFDARYYVARNPVARDNPLLHYMTIGRKAGCSTIFRADIRDYMKSTGRLTNARKDLCIDIIIPVYRGLEETQRCVQSVLADTERPNGRVIVVDDCSPEREISRWLDDMSCRGLVHLLRNVSNLGFVASVNLGMKEAKRNDVILLNSDTEVPLGWLRRLAAHAYSEPRVGTVTPYSNNATICSYPSFAGGELPFGKTLSEIDDAAQVSNAGRSVDIPTAVGFAMYIRRDCLDEVGAFDEETFGRGYGEENDFCLRATAAGWKHKLACDVFVYHAGEVSFGKNSSERQRAWSLLIERHPLYPSSVASHIENDPGASFRIALTAELFSRGNVPVTLLVSHNLGGGTQRHVNDLINGTKGKMNWISLVPCERGVRVTFPSISEHPYLELGADRVDDLIVFLRSLHIDRIHIHHVIGFSIDIRAIVESLVKPFDFTVHDYFVICPQVNMLPDPYGPFCNEPDESACNACIDVRPSFGATDIIAWRRRFAWLLLDADRVFCPDQDVLERLVRLGVGGRAVVSTHEPSLRVYMPRPRSLSPGSKMRIAVLGVLAPLKGLRLFEKLVRISDQKHIQYFILGDAQPGISEDIHANVEITGFYRDEELQTLIQKYAPHIVLFPGIVPETYSFTLSAALAARVPIICADIGALASRTKTRPWTLHVQPSTEPSDWLKAIEHMRLCLVRGVWSETDESDATASTSPLVDVRSRGSRAKPLFVLPELFGNGSPTPCGYIRSLLPYSDLDQIGDARVDLIDPTSLPRIRDSIVIAQRHATKSVEAADEFIATCRANGTRILYDLDDDLINIPPWHPEFDYLESKSNIVKRFLLEADAVTVSTSALAKRFAPLRKDCIVFENALDIRIWKGLRQQPAYVSLHAERRCPVRILYFGTATHDAELRMLQVTFEHLKEQYGDSVEIDVLGVTNRELWKSVNRVVPPSTNYLSLANWLNSTRRWDIGLAPLVDNDFNAVKSHIKLLDYTAIGCSIVASDLPPYQGSFRDTNAALFVANTSGAWNEGLSKLIESPKLRAQLHSAALEVTRANFILQNSRRARTELLARLCGRIRD